MTILLEPPAAPEVVSEPAGPRGRLDSITGGHSAKPLVLLTALAITDTFDVAALGVLLPEIRDYFGVNLQTILTVSTIAGLLPLLLAVPIGFLSDRVRRTRLVGLGFILSGLFSTGTGLSTGLIILGVMRLGAGLGKCFEGGTQSLLADYYPPDKRAGVFSVFSTGQPVALVISPVVAGVLGERYGWQVPFLLCGIPTLLLSLLIFTLRDPVRGAQERRAMGATDDVAQREEKPPGWTEGWRIARNVRTLRRIWAALPFLVGALVVGNTLLSVYFHDVFGLSDTSRGALTSFQQLALLAGLILGAPFMARLQRRNPARLIAFAGLMASVQALTFVVIALSPWLWLALVATILGALASAPLGPAAVALMSLTCSPRVRAFAQSFGALFVALGLVFAPFAGALADSYGQRAGIAFMAPVFLVGALIIASAGPSVTADIRAATAAAMATHIARESREEGRAKLLVCKDLDAGYGQVQILFGVDLEIEQGEIVALLGTNGAGKSTLLSAISGRNPASNGAVVFDGEEITYLPASDHITRGIVSMPGGKGTFPSLTVAENLRLATWKSDADVAARLDRVFAFFPRLREREHELAGNLSGGEQQMLALSQAFLSKPRLLMIDELSLGLAPTVVEQLLSIVRSLHEEGTTIILVEQSVNVALTLAERVVFMEKGEVRFTGPAAELLERPDVLRSVFLAGSASAGGSFARGNRATRQDQDVVLSVQDVTRSFGGVKALTGASLELRSGQTLGIIGPNGAGKSTLFDVISGFVTPDAGTVSLLGEDVTDVAPDLRAVRGLGRSFQDARLFPALTVEENLLVTLDRHHRAKNLGATALGLPKVRKAEAVLRKRAERLIDLLGVGEFRDKFVRELSTGSRRLVDLACVLAADPEVLLLDEPSSGIAQRETEEMPALLERIKFETGCAMLIIEHDMQLITAVSDEIVAMELGRDVLRGEPAVVLADPRVVAAYLGGSEAAIRRSDKH